MTKALENATIFFFPFLYLVLTNVHVFMTPIKQIRLEHTDIFCLTGAQKNAR